MEKYQERSCIKAGGMLMTEELHFWLKRIYT